MKGSDSILEAEGNATITPALASDATYRKLPPAQQAVVKAAAERESRSRRQKQYDEAQAEANRLEKIRLRVEKVLREHGLSQDVRTLIDERGLVISLVSRHVVFRADVADLSPRGRKVVDALAPVLKDLPDAAAHRRPHQPGRRCSRPTTPPTGTSPRPARSPCCAG